MKTLLMASLFFAFINCSVYAQTNPIPMAADTVLLVLKLVGADKREDFDRFLRDVFLAGTVKLNPTDQQLFKQMRIFNPVKMQDDGTYSYFFLVKSPVNKDGDYYIKSWLTKMYGAEKAAEYIKTFNNAISFGDVQLFMETYSKD